jgi:glutamate/tyrosine decarboxylase-like PLP-dependent enzyme
MKLDVTIPTTGEPRAEVLERMRSMKTGDADWRGGRTWSLVYHGGEEHEALLKEAYGLFISENFLNPMAFKSLKRMEAEVVTMTIDMLNGGEACVGTMTSGGTESVLMAVKAARQRARAKWPWIRRPQLVAPRSIHVAFEKACHYFGVQLVAVPLDDDCRVNVRALKRRVGRNTILIAASAPQFPHGVIDPIEEIAEFAQAKGVPFHVDACIGGFLLPWLEKNGHAVPRWDFRVPGVTSISADVHKYGYASKGASVIAYRSMDYLRHQFFVSTDWPGGIYASPTMAGTRPGGAIAAAWAAMRTMGQDGYQKMARETMEATQRYLDGIAQIPEVKVLGKPDMCLVAIASNDPDVDIYAVADRLDTAGWNMDRQQRPASIHVTLTSNHLTVLDQYLADLRDAVAYVKANPEAAASGTAPMYGMMAKVPMRGMVKRSVVKVMEQMFGPDGGMGDLAELSDKSGEDDKVMQLVDRYGPKVLDLLRKAEGARDEFIRRLRSFLPG